MPDYAKALKEGFAAALKADAARKEIDEVFKDFNTQVLQATENMVSIERREKVEGSVWTTVAYGLGRMAGDPNVNPPAKYWAIVAFNPFVGSNGGIELARWGMDRAGYPCKVMWNKQDHVCEDKEALMNCLSELLKDPIIGQKLYTLTRLEPKEPT